MAEMTFIANHQLQFDNYKSYRGYIGMPSLCRLQ